MCSMFESVAASGNSDHGEWAISDQERQAIIQFCESIGATATRWLFLERYNPNVQVAMQPYITFFKRAYTLGVLEGLIINSSLTRLATITSNTKL